MTIVHGVSIGFLDLIGKLFGLDLTWFLVQPLVRSYIRTQGLRDVLTQCILTRLLVLQGLWCVTHFVFIFNIHILLWIILVRRWQFINLIHKQIFFNILNLVFDRPNIFQCVWPTHITTILIYSVNLISGFWIDIELVSVSLCRQYWFACKMCQINTLFFHIEYFKIFCVLTLLHLFIWFKFWRMYVCISNVITTVIIIHFVQRLIIINIIVVFWVRFSIAILYTSESLDRWVLFK